MTSSAVRASALASVGAAVAVYALMLLGYRQGWGWLAAADAAALDATHDIALKHSDWVRFWAGISTVFSPAVFRALGMVAAMVALVRRRLRAALFLLLAVETSGLLTALAKGSVGRPRPVTALVAGTSTSFPSGHALGATIGVGALLMLSLPMLRRHARIVVLGAGALVVVAVGVARVALNVHHPSDVLAGWALGWGYLTVWALVIKPWKRGVARASGASRDDAVSVDPRRAVNGV